MLVAYYLDSAIKPIRQQIEAEGHTACGGKAYLWEGEILPCDAVYAPGRPDIAAAYADKGIKAFSLSGGPAVHKQVSLPHYKEILVVSCGPSGPSVLKSRNFNCPIIGVNTVVTWLECDYWVALDGAHISSTRLGKQVVGNPVPIVADNRQCDRVGKWARLEDYAKRGTWTSVTAVEVAAAIADTVYCVGFDWTHGEGSDGLVRDASRNFTHETDMFQALALSSSANIIRIMPGDIAEPRKWRKSRRARK